MVPSPVWIEVPRYSRALPVTNEIYSKKATAATTKGAAENEGAVEEMRGVCAHRRHSHIISLQYVTGRS